MEPEPENPSQDDYQHEVWQESYWGDEYQKIYEPWKEKYDAVMEKYNNEYEVYSSKENRDYYRSKNKKKKARGRMTPTSGFVLLSLPTSHPPAQVWF